MWVLFLIYIRNKKVFQFTCAGSNVNAYVVCFYLNTFIIFPNVIKINNIVYQIDSTIWLNTNKKLNKKFSKVKNNLNNASW